MLFIIIIIIIIITYLPKV